MNVLTKFTEVIVHYTEGLSSQTIQFWLRLVLLLMLPVIICAWTFRQGYRSVFIQVLAGVFGVLVALSLPLQHFQITSGMARIWLLTFAILALIFLPTILPALLLPTVGAQRKLRQVLIFAVLALVIANLLWG